MNVPTMFDREDPREARCERAEEVRMAGRWGEGRRMDIERQEELRGVRSSGDDGPARKRWRAGEPPPPDTTETGDVGRWTERGWVGPPPPDPTQNYNR